MSFSLPLSTMVWNESTSSAICFVYWWLCEPEYIISLNIVLLAMQRLGDTSSAYMHIFVMFFVIGRFSEQRIQIC